MAQREWALAAAWTGRRVRAACAAAHRVLAPDTKWMLLSPTYVCLCPCHGSNTRHRKAKSAVVALEGGRSHQAKPWEDVAKLAAERVHRQLAVGLVLPVPFAHANLGTFPKARSATWRIGGRVPFFFFRGSFLADESSMVDVATLTMLLSRAGGSASYLDDGFAIPTRGDPARAAWVRRVLGAKLLRHAPREALEAMIRGVEAGGAPPSQWVAEPDSTDRISDRARGGLGNASFPLALDMLCGAKPHEKGRAHVVRALAASDFPVDAYAEALVASGNRHEVDHLANWFSSVAEGRTQLGCLVWHYQRGCLVEQRAVCNRVREMSARARRLLAPTRFGATLGAERPTTARHRTTKAAQGTPTGRTATLPLPPEKDAVIADARDALRERGDPTGRRVVVNIIKLGRDARCKPVTSRSSVTSSAAYLTSSGRRGRRSHMDASVFMQTLWPQRFALKLEVFPQCVRRRYMSGF